MNAPPFFEWKCEPEAEAVVMEFLGKATRANPCIAKLQEELHKYTSTRLFDWIDHIVIGSSLGIKAQLENAGFLSDHATPTYRVLFHPGAQLPKVVLKDEKTRAVGIAVKVESIANFLMVRGLSGWIEGTPLSPYRRCCVSIENETSLWVVERRVGHGMEPTFCGEAYPKAVLEAQEKWQTRPRDLQDEDEAMTHALAVAEDLVTDLGEDMAAWVVLECERNFWQSKNKAAQIQKNRQDRLGMGWANHDHHTFRSSRTRFSQLVRLFEMLGFKCRERFYAGKEAGWGAQVMENVRSGLVLFLDLDLQPEELQIDFAHSPLGEIRQLGTVGLWCALHGDSILRAGMHHLEAQFYFNDLTEDLAQVGIGMMEPFSDFSYLKQAFTHGEIWHVDADRAKRLVEKNWITQEEVEKFLKYGAVGSHLENLQRREGYKGFNQKNVSFIIQKTDPRRQRGVAKK